LHYRDHGSGPCIVFVHGLFVNGGVWDDLVPLLAGRRCLLPDLPLGAHRTPMNGADLSPPGLAAMIAEFIEQLELHDVTVVGNDTGGALCQILCANRPELVDRLVLTNCDTFENFPPLPFRASYALAGRVPGLIAGVGQALRHRMLWRAGLAVVPVTMRPLPDDLLAGWFAALRDPRIRADLQAVFRAISPKHTLAAAELLATYDRPTLIAWGTRDRLFRVRDAQRLANLLPNARLELIDDSRTYVQIDQPRRLAELMTNWN
jgi:pimeloyl-ACP methyl ester carboxylesterase